MGRGEHCKHASLACVGSARSVWATPGLPSMLSRSTPLRLRAALLGSSLRQALGCVHFPGLSCSGSWVLHKCSDLVGPTFCALPSQVRAAQAARCLASSPFTVGPYILSPPWSQPLGFLGAQRQRHLRCAVWPLWGANLWLWPSWWMSTVHDPGKTWLATGGLLTVWWRMPSLGQRLPLSPGSGCCPPASLPLAGDEPVCSQLALLWYSLSPLFCERPAVP